MAGSLAPVMYWAVRATLCFVLQSDAKPLSYQVVMQTVKMFSMVQLYNFLRIWWPITKRMWSHVSFMTVGVCGQWLFLSDVDTEELEPFDPALLQPRCEWECARPSVSIICHTGCTANCIVRNDMSILVLFVPLEVTRYQRPDLWLDYHHAWLALFG
jgi:hypothetical protein